MPQFLGSPLVIVIAAGVTLLALAVPLVRMIQIYAGVDKRRPFDVSSAGLTPPPELVPTISALMRLGFKRVGEAGLVLPGTKAVALSATGSPRLEGESSAHHTIFVMVDGGATVVAETGQVPGVPILVSLNSAFGDGSVVETMYPRGESIDDPDFHSGHNSVSLEAAYMDQLTEIRRWTMRHGSPRLVGNMGDYLRTDAEYRDRFAKRKLRGPLLRRQIGPAALIAMAVFAIALYMLLRWPN
jgi:hypothetical protein